MLAYQRTVEQISISVDPYREDSWREERIEPPANGRTRSVFGTSLRDSALGCGEGRISFDQKAELEEKVCSNIGRFTLDLSPSCVCAASVI
jgi:hypothetical protein